MKKWNWKSYVAGLLTGALVLCSVPVIAAGITGNQTTAKVFVDGNAVAVDAYNINDYNYFKLRDFCAAVDVGVWYNGASNSIYIERDKGYDPNYTGPGSIVAPTPTNTYGWQAYYKTDDYNKYTTPALVNNLDGTMLTVTGIIDAANQDNGIFYYILSTDNGKWLFIPFADTHDNLNLNTGDKVTIYGIYQGVSTKYDNLPVIYVTRMIGPNGLYSAHMTGIETGALYEGKSFDEIHALLHNTDTSSASSAPTSTPAPTSSPVTAKLNSANDVKNYLTKKYSTLSTSVGFCNMSFTIFDRHNSLYLPYDYDIQIGYDESILYQIQHGDQYTIAQRNSAKNELKQFMITINDDLSAQIPGVKLEGCYFAGYYDYPSISVGYHSTSFANWANYDWTKSDLKSDKNYETIKADGFEWHMNIDVGWNRGVLAIKLIKTIGQEGV